MDEESHANPYGFKAAFCPTFGGDDGVCEHAGWVSPYHFGINVGPIVMMLENYHSDLVWRLTRQCQVFVNGLRLAGSEGGWLCLTTRAKGAWPSSMQAR